MNQYALATVTYDTSSAPYLAVSILMQFAGDEEQVYPRTAIKKPLRAVSIITHLFCCASIYFCVQEVFSKDIYNQTKIIFKFFRQVMGPV